MTRTLLLLTLGLALSCGPADDAGSPAPGSTDTPIAGAAAGNPGHEAPAPVRADPSTPADAAREPARAVFLGTSLTAGLGLLRDSERFTSIVQALADSAGIPVTVVNAGVSGDTSAGGLRRLSWVLQEPADVLVVELGANDGLRGQSVEAMKENLETIVRRARELSPGVRIVLAGMQAPPNLGERYTGAFRQAFRDLAREQEITLVPFLLDGVAGVPEMNLADRIHPNVQGHRRIARTLWPVLEPVFREAVQARAVER